MQSELFRFLLLRLADVVTDLLVSGFVQVTLDLFKSLEVFLLVFLDQTVQFLDVVTLSGDLDALELIVVGPALKLWKVVAELPSVYFTLLVLHGLLLLLVVMSHA